MSKKIKYILLTGLIIGSFIFGVSSGHYKHFPFNILYLVKNGEKLPNKPKYTGRMYDTKGLIHKHVDVSDRTGIYLTYGQSNSVNSGELGYDVKNDVYQFILGNTFDYEDPSLGGNGTGGSVWGMVGDKLIEKGFHDKVIFSNSGWGGKKIEELNRGGFFDFLIFNYKTLIDKYGRVDGILYHQGESDNNPQGVKEYYNNFSKFITNLNDEGINIPIYLSRVSLCGEKRPINNKLTNIQNQLINDYEIIKEGPNTDLLSKKTERLKDYCHFSLEGFDKFSDMWVESLIR